MVNISVTEEIFLDGESLRDLVKMYGENAVLFEHQSYDECSIRITYNKTESEEHFKKIFDQYLRDLEIYNKWREENIDIIERKDRERLERAKAREAKKLEDKKQKLDRLEKEMEKLRKELST
jgi:hypothetical protein